MVSSDLEREHQLFGPMSTYGEGGAETRTQAGVTSLRGDLDVVRVVVAPLQDHEILESSGDDQSALVTCAEVARAKPRLLALDQPPTERGGRLVRTSPVPARDTGTRDPDLADLAVAHRGQGFRINDRHLVLVGVRTRS